MLQTLPYLAQLALQTITHQVYARIPARPQHRVSSSARPQWSKNPLGNVWLHSAHVVPLCLPVAVLLSQRANTTFEQLHP